MASVAISIMRCSHTRPTWASDPSPSHSPNPNPNPNQDDDTYPSPAPDGYEYWSRTIKGKSFRVYLRRPVGSGAGDQEQTILDVNEVETSPSGKLLAYAVDGSGYETYNIRLDPNPSPPNPNPTPNPDPDQVQHPAQGPHHRRRDGRGDSRDG
eukprot:scaffold87931_cov43-Phaeocystis_antarctica.AAC.2